MRVRTRAFAIALAAAAGLLGAGRVEAAALRYQIDQRGDFVLFGNTVAQDCGSGVPAVTVGMTASGASCGNNRTDTAPDIFWRSDDAATASAATTVTVANARSTSMLAIPAGATITYARLYWSAPQSAAGTDTSVVVDRAGTGAFSTPITADASHTATANSRTYYQSTADVTALVQARGVGAYRVSGIDTLAFLDLNDETVYVAWSMVVFYRRDADPPRNLTLFDGLDAIQTTGPSVTVNLSGFLVPTAGFDAKLGVVTYEGDDQYDGDALSFNGVALSDASNPVNDFFNSTHSYLGTPVSNAGDLPQLTGGPRSMGGFDIDVVNITPRLSQGQTSATITASTNLDFYLLGVFVTSISTFKPDFTGISKTVTNLANRPGGVVFPGDVIEYTIVATNQGNDGATNVVMNDVVPAGLTYVPGSIQITAGANIGVKSDSAGNDQGEYLSGSRTVRVRLGTGANGTTGGTIAIGASTTVVFRATVDASALGQIANQAVVTASGASGAPAADYLTRGDGGGAGAPPPTVIIVDRCTQDTDCNGATPFCLTSANPNICIGCRTAADCPGATPTCDTVTHACRTCAAAVDCPGGAPVCLGTGRCGECSAGNQTHCTGATPACDTAASVCVECVSNATCGGTAPVCDTVAKQCVGCLMNSDCSGSTPYCDLAMKTCRGCGVDGECGGGATACQPSGACGQCSAGNAMACMGATPVCETGAGACVGCTTGSHCGGTAPVCNPASHVCQPCSGDGDCGGATPACQPSGACGQCSAGNRTACAGATPVCDTSSATCVGCVAAADCSGGTPVCDGGSKTCRGCTGNSECGAITPVCQPSGACVQCTAGNTAACSGVRPLCDGIANVCVGCLSAADCGGGTPICDSGTRICRACSGDGDCGGATPACMSTGVCGECSASNRTACGGSMSLCDVAAGVCVGCVSSADCDGLAPTCDGTTRTCRPCTASADCSGATAVCLPSGACGECAAGNTAACTAPRTQCDTAGARCVECLTAANCSGATPVCDTAAGTCGRCTSDAQCGGSTAVCQPSGACGQCSDTNKTACTAARPLCDQTSGVGACVGCITNADCGGAAPLCSPSTRTCVGCSGDGAPSCTDPERPVCQTTGAMAGACGECSATDSSRCGGAKPRCLTAYGLCGCSDANGDSDCGGASSGLICSGTVGICVPGCSGAPMRNGCPTGQTCSVLTGAPGTCGTPGGGACTGNGDCAAPTGTCDTGAPTARCVQCVNDSGCSAPLVCATASGSCVECTPTNATACDAAGSGDRCLPAGTCGCQSDDDCGGVRSGRICNATAGTCTVGCRAVSGNGCPVGLVCTSSSTTPGACIPPPPVIPDGGADASGDAATGMDGAGGAGDGGSNLDGSADGNRDALADGPRPDGVAFDGSFDGRQDGASGDGTGGRLDGAGGDQNVGEAGVGLPRAYLAGGGCQCELPSGAPPSGAAGALLLALLAVIRRRGRR